MEHFSTYRNHFVLKLLALVLLYTIIWIAPINIALAQKGKKADPVITWFDPAPITYGAALSKKQLNAKANVAGSFIYSPPVNTVLDGGVQTLSTTFTPINSANYNSITKTVTIIVNKASATLTLVGLEHTHDGSPKQATVTTSPTGLGSVSVTYDGSSTPPSAVGSYAVEARLDNQNYAAAPASGNLVIKSAVSEASISLSNLTQTYSGSARTVTATTTPAGLSHTVTYDGAAAAPVNVGSYEVVATITEPNYSGSATGTLVVGKASATLTLVGLEHTHDGSPKQATVTTSPAGLGSVSVTYDGSSTPPSAVGSYAVEARLDNQNYAAAPASGNLVITNSSAQITKIVVLGSSTALGSGASSSSKTWVNSLSSQLDIEFPNRVSVTNLARGGYTTYHILPTGTSNENNRPAVDPERNISAALKLKPDIILINLPSNDVSNGYSDAESFGNFSNIISTARNAGVKVLLTGTQPRTDLALAARQRLQSQNQSLMSIYGYDCVNIYDELADFTSYTIKYNYNYGDNIHINDAGHAYIYSMMLPQVKNLIEGKPTGGKIRISLSLSNLNQVYDGSPKTVTVITDPAALEGINVTYNGSTTSPTAIGSYQVIASLDNQYYTATPVTGTFVIEKKAIPLTKIVVIGSSTAQGSGASHSSRRWVNLLANQLNIDYPNMISVINLGIGGLQTFGALPTGTDNGCCRQQVNPDRNITAAMSHNPQIILINLPSNDAQAGIPLETTINNFATIINTAEAAGVKVLLTGTQPRNDISLAARQLLYTTNQRLQSIYRNDCISVYDEFTDFETYTIKPQYSYGDNIHINDAGHAYIYSMMLPQVKSLIEGGSDVFDTKSLRSYLSSSNIAEEKLSLSALPNPFTEKVLLDFKSNNDSHTTLQLYDTRGILVKQIYQGYLPSGEAMSIEMSSVGLAKGVYILRLYTEFGAVTKRIALVK